MTTSEISPLLLLEQDSLHECETVIERGLATFVDVGTALARIRDGRLYRATHATFEDYCRDRWGFNDSRARQLIIAAQTASELGSVTNVTVTNEGQARAIAPTLKEHGPEFAAEVLKQAAELGLTAKSIQQTAERAVATRLQAESRRQQQAQAAAEIETYPAARAELNKLIDRLDDGETIVINLRDPMATILEQRKYLTRIDRGSDWGNPFVVDHDGTRDQVIAAYRDYYLPHKPSLKSRLHELRGRALGCWCAPQPCHGDVLVEAVGRPT